MTERTDHAARSVMFGGLATDAWNANQREFATALLASAQVHATLALVEQQRIANVIAFTTVNGNEPTDSLAEEIADAIGIPPQPLIP